MIASIPLASMAAISLIGVFARQNHNAGWVKKRKFLIDSLRQARRDLLATPHAPESVSSVAYAGLPVDPTEFSGQLSRLRSSVHRANQPPVETGAPGVSHGSSGKNTSKAAVTA